MAATAGASDIDALQAHLLYQTGMRWQPGEVDGHTMLVSETCERSGLDGFLTYVHNAIQAPVRLQPAGEDSALVKICLYPKVAQAVLEYFPEKEKPPVRKWAGTVGEKGSEPSPTMAETFTFRPPRELVH